MSSIQIIEKIKKEWMLRLRSARFIMLVNKRTNEYRNMYAENKSEIDLMNTLANQMDIHPKLKENEHE